MLRVREPAEAEKRGPTYRLPRGRYLTLQQAAEAFPAFTPRLLRRLVQERRLPFSRAGRCIVIAEADIHAYLERNRVEPPRWDVAS
ncbi:MAG: helix-turn-helix domain-containing protein [Acidimicrobiales bacterium]